MKKKNLLTTLWLAIVAACSGQSQVGFQDLDVQQFKQKMSEPSVVILDVRTPQETAQGKIAGAIELDFRNANFAAEAAKLDKEKTYLVYCRSGARSSQACKIMAEKGFKNLFNLSGGYLKWQP